MLRGKGSFKTNLSSLKKFRNTPKFQTLILKYIVKKRCYTTHIENQIIQFV